MAPSKLPGFVLTWAPTCPRGARPTLARALSQPAVACRGSGGRCCVQRGPILRSAVLGTQRAQGSKAAAWCLSRSSPPQGVPRRTFAIRAARKRERPPGRERQLRRHGSRPPERGGASRRHAGGLRPCTQSASPGGGLAVVRSGAFSSAWAPAGFFSVGPFPPRVRAPSSRAPVSTTAQQAQLVRCRVHRGCRVFGDRGARRPRDVRCREGGE